MSNPVATLSFSISKPGIPTLTRNTYTVIYFEQEDFFQYAVDQWDAAYTKFEPEGHGTRSYFFLPIKNAFLDSTYGSSTIPCFISSQSFPALGNAASGFLTSEFSVMPKIIVPSTCLVDNGSVDVEKYKAIKTDTSENLFNWELTDKDGGGKPADIFKEVGLGGFEGSQFLTVKSKTDTDENSSVTMVLDEPPDPKPTGFWTSGSANDLVVTGCFALMLNITPTRSGKSNPSAAAEKSWLVEMDFGDVNMKLQESGALTVNVGGEELGNTGVANLNDSQAKEGPPQMKNIAEGDAFLLLVYPVWNGVIVTNGVQDAKSTVNVSSVFVPKLKEAAIFQDTYSTKFDPLAPDQVLVGIGAGDTSVLVGFGDTLTVTATNCRADLAYVPCFFSHRLWFDEWFLTQKNTATVNYTYNVYPIWTKNGTAAEFLPVPEINAITKAGPTADTEFKLVQWRMQMPKPNRFGGQIFGSYLCIEEENKFPSKNDNGSFSLSFSGGTPGDPSPSTDWTDYIQSISVTIGFDGSSGSIVVDKYGFAGQTAEATQSVGAIRISMDSGAAGTVGGEIFAGFALGVTDQQSIDGANVTIPLAGQERKFEDMMFLLPPFFDGFILFEVLDYITRYAGIVADYTAAPAVLTTELTINQDVAAPIFDFKIGTSVKEGLKQVMENVRHTYVVRNGEIFFYELDPDTSVPKILGTDWGPSYPDTKIVQVEQNPNFDVIRNQIVAFSLREIPDGKGADPDLPLFPAFGLVSQTTEPEFPWMKAWLEPVNGIIPGQAELDKIVASMAEQSKAYIITGRTTIPGNASIVPYDKFGDLVISSVTHNIDFVSKSWTTDLEFISFPST
jgi:hypothetical protein